jgi:hypothetical protein
MRIHRNDWIGEAGVMAWEMVAAPAAQCLLLSLLPLTPASFLKRQLEFTTDDN